MSKGLNNDQQNAVAKNEVKTRILLTITLNNDNIAWLLENEPMISEIATAFFATVKQNYLATQQIPSTLKNYINKTF